MMKTATRLAATAALIGTGLAAFILLACSDGGDDASAPWPSDYSSVFSKFIFDPADDLEPIADGPLYPVSLPSVDVVQVSLGVQGDYLYIRIDYAGVIPTAPVYIPYNPPVEEQAVHDHQTNVVINNVLYILRVGYGFSRPLVSALYDCVPSADICYGKLVGELGEGGTGYDYAIVRHNVSDLGILFPRGANVGIDGWSEAMSYDSNGNELYHHYAFDSIDSSTWTLPQW